MSSQPSASNNLSAPRIPSSSTSTRPMLSPIRTQPPFQPYAGHSQSALRTPSTYTDDPSGHPWGPTSHFVQQGHHAHQPSIHGSLLDNNPAFPSNSHHQHQQQHQSYIVNSNVYLPSPTRSLTPPDSANPYSSSMSPIASTLPQQTPASGKAPKASGRAARGQGKATGSGARGTTIAAAGGSSSVASASAAARTTQPKSNRKQFSACGACQLRQSVLISLITPCILVYSSTTKLTVTDHLFGFHLILPWASISLTPYFVMFRLRNLGSNYLTVGDHGEFRGATRFDLQTILQKKNPPS